MSSGRVPQAPCFYAERNSPAAAARSSRLATEAAVGAAVGYNGSFGPAPCRLGAGRDDPLDRPGRTAPPHATAADQAVWFGLGRVCQCPSPVPDRPGISAADEWHTRTG